jgi:peptidyl-prolyl cis-trans isomerase SurA
MIKKSARLVFFLSLVLSSAWGQSQDPVVINVAGKDITRSEFEYSFNKNNSEVSQKDSKAINEYVNMFINYQLKVKAAEDAQLDTLKSFQEEFATYRDMQLKPYIDNPEYIDSVAHEVYDYIKEQLGDSDQVLLSHIFLLVPQKADEALKSEKKARIDSIYNALQSGADFAELAHKHSEDAGSAAKGGLLPWLGPKQAVPEFIKEAYALQPGQMSKPFLSSAGYHILLMKERKQLEPYDEKKNEIIPILEARGIKDMAAEAKIEKLAKSQNKSREELMSEVQANAIKQDPSLVYLIKEYHDGLLLYEASNRMVWQKAAADVKGLKTFFGKHKKQYVWDAPRFKGYVIHAKNDRLIQQAEKFFKKHKGYDGMPAFTQEFKDSLKHIRVKYGVYKASEDAYVDAAFFGKEKPKPNKIFPVNKVNGKLIRKPEVYEDVLSQVVSDYQDLKEKEWVEGLRKKYSYTINEDVLKTVNNH